MSPRKYESAILQNPWEIDEFCRLVEAERITSYLEIGSKFGGSLWRVVNAMESGGRVVAVDLPHGDTSFKESLPPLEDCCAQLRKRGYNVRLIIGDSTDPAVVAQVTRLGPFDLVFIDANHTEPFVRKDWANYGPLGRIVAFHDIAWQARPEPSKKMPIEVPKVWAELRQKHRHREIRVPGTRDNGIGVLWTST